MSAVRLECLRLAHDVQPKGSMYNPERVIEIARQYEEFVLSGNADTGEQPPADRPKAGRRRRT